MKTKYLLIAATLLAFSLGPTLRAEGNVPGDLSAAAKTISKEKDQLAVQQTLLDFADAPQVAHFFKKSYGCAVFPTIGKGGFWLGGSYGTGYVFADGHLLGTAKVTQVTLGFQAGGQAFSQIIFFEDERAFKAFTNDNFEFGAQASAVAITAGANAGASTAGGANAAAGNSQAKKDYTDGMAIFTKAKGGLMYEATIGGQKFKYRPIKK